VQNQNGPPGYWDFDVAFTPFGALQRAGLTPSQSFAMIEPATRSEARTRQRTGRGVPSLPV
jgi:hypothetical protein